MIEPMDLHAPNPATRFCKECSASLAESVNHQCPECGAEFNPCDPKTTLKHSVRAGPKARVFFGFAATFMAFITLSLWWRSAGFASAGAMCFFFTWIAAYGAIPFYRPPPKRNLD